MGSVVELYEALASAPDERVRARARLMWLIPLMFAQVGAMAALVKLL
jgi:hypothetical protein